jgi:hypothetical protein
MCGLFIVSASNDFYFVKFTSGRMQKEGNLLSLGVTLMFML